MADKQYVGAVTVKRRRGIANYWAYFRDTTGKQRLRSLIGPRLLLLLAGLYAGRLLLNRLHRLLSGPRDAKAEETNRANAVDAEYEIVDDEKANPLISTTMSASTPTKVSKGSARPRGCLRSALSSSSI